MYFFAPSIPRFVTPAKAGVHCCAAVDPGLRRDDGTSCRLKKVHYCQLSQNYHIDKYILFGYIVYVKEENMTDSEIKTENIEPAPQKRNILFYKVGVGPYRVYMALSSAALLSLIASMFIMYAPSVVEAVTDSMPDFTEVVKNILCKLSSKGSARDGVANLMPFLGLLSLPAIEEGSNILFRKLGITHPFFVGKGPR